MPFDPFGDYATRGYLRNRLAEADVAKLRKLEHIGFSGRVVDALTFLTHQPYLSYAHLQRTHQILFNFLYPWAGSDRKATAPTLSIGKGSYKDLFARPEEIELACNSALSLTDEDLAAKPGLAFTRLAYAHPFLDMNGRTILTFHSALIRRVHIYIRWDRIAKAPFLAELTKDLLEEKGVLDELIKPHIYPGRRQIKTLASYIENATTRRK